MTRDDRQRAVAKWCGEAFGADHATSVPQRAVRMLEEAIELYQACGADKEMAHRLIDFVFDRPVGLISAELGGIGLTVLALAEAAGFSADFQEGCELGRVLGKSLAHFHARNQAKNQAGFDATAYPISAIDGNLRNP